MFSKLVADLLTSYLGEYFENIDCEHVKVSVWNGIVHMKNLRVRQDALRFLDVPVCVMMGTIEELTVVIPWMHLRSESVVVQIRKAQLILADKETAGYSIDQDVREACARKIRALAATDEALLIAFRKGLAQACSSVSTPTSVPPPAEDAVDSSDNNFTARLKASILTNIRVEVKEALVHYTSCVAGAVTAGDGMPSGGIVGEASLPLLSQGQQQYSVQSSNLQASISFEIKEIKTCGCNERFEPAFVAPGERIARRLISFRGLEASLQTGTNNERAVSLLKPFDVSVELAYQPVHTDVSTPQCMAAVHMDAACFCTITSEVCTTCYGFVQYLAHVRQRQALRRLRPMRERPSANPHRWWRYTLDAVRQQLQNNKAAALVSAHKLAPFSWLTYTSMKQKRDRYMQLYLRHQRISLRATEWLEPLTVDEHVEMVMLEEELSIDILRLGKRLAMRRVNVERAEYEKLLRERKAVFGSSEADTTSPVRPSAPPAQLISPVVKGGWFSFWRSESQPPVSKSASVSDAADDAWSDEARAELRELVQLMTTERWADVQRAVIAQELGVPSEEANALSPFDSPLSASTQDPTAVDSSRKPILHRSVPSCVVFLHAKEIRVELRSSALSGSSTPSLTTRKVEAFTRAPDTLAQVALHTLQAGVEWGGVSAANWSDLQAAHYWGTMERFSITVVSLAALETRQSTHASTDEAILSIHYPDVRQEASQRDPSWPLQRSSEIGSPPTSVAKKTKRMVSAHQPRLRTFSPLESCWSILPEECRRHAAVRIEWTVQSAQQRVSQPSALHCVRIGLALVHVLIDVVPLRHLSDFLFRVVWPETTLPRSTAGSSIGEANASTSPPVDASDDNNFTALAIPVSPRMTHAEERCAIEGDARLIALQRRVEQQCSIDWSVAMDTVNISLSEVPQEQGCELTLTQVRLRNDVVHSLQLQGRLRREASKELSNSSTFPTATTATTTAALGSLGTDWIDRTHLQMAAVRLSVFFPRSKPSADGPLPIERVVLLHDTAISAVVERSLLGRGHPTLPQWNLQISSSDAVDLAWSRTSLSVLTTSCTLLADLAASIEAKIQARGAGQIGSVRSPQDEAVYVFRVRVLPHPTGRKFWSSACGQGDEPGDVNNDAPPCAADERQWYCKQLHPFSAARQLSTVMASASLRQRVIVRMGVCVVYHAQRPTFPAYYYTLQDGCTHVLLDDGTRDSGVTAAAGVTTGPCVHLYVSQGGRTHEQGLARGYSNAKRLLLDALKLPPALLENAFWLKRAVNEWLEKVSEVDNNSVPSHQQVRQALGCFLAGAHAVPCRYVSFQCASEAEACALAAALRGCCVGATTPPLLLRPSVQTRYNIAVSASELRKQPLYSLTLSFPALRMTCEGSEPAVCLDTLEVKSDSASACRSPRRDAVLSFTSFFLRQECYRDKWSYELSAADSVALCARFRDSVAHDSDIKVFDVCVPSSSSTAETSSRTTRDSIAFFMRFVNYKRPSPLPSWRQCTMRVGSSARMYLQACPTLLECGEALWDTMGLLTNRLFDAEVIVGYPWWRPLCSDEGTQMEKENEGADAYSRIVMDVEAEWCGTSEYGGNALCSHVDVTVPALQVNVDLEGGSGEPTMCREFSVLRFTALDAVLEWRMTEACHHLQMSAESPQLQWCCPSATGVVPGREKWITLMQPNDAPTPSESCVDSAKLSVDWKQHRPPPMLSFSDWLCAKGGVGEDVAKMCVMGIRDTQELHVYLRHVRLLFLYPFFMHILGALREGLVKRAAAVVAREPCWFCDGTLLCPPLSWQALYKAAGAVSWTHMRKSVALYSVVLHMPRQVDLLAQASFSALLPSPKPYLLLSVAHLFFSDRVQGSALSSPSDCSSMAKSVDIVLDIHSSDMVISHAQLSSGAPFQWRLPSWHISIASPVFDVRCLWVESMPWRKSFVVVLPSLTESCALHCSSADLAHVIDIIHGNFFQFTDFDKEIESDAVDASSPASLLKRVAVEKTWTLSMKGEATLCIATSRSDSSHSISHSMHCLLRLRGAAASAVRSARGEVSCSFSVQRVWLGCGAPSIASSDFSESNGQCVLQIVPWCSAAAAPVASLALQYGWRWLVNPREDSTSSTSTEALPEREIFLSVDSLGSVIATAHGEAVGLLRTTIVDDPNLRGSLLRYMDHTALTVSRAKIPTHSHESSGGNVGGAQTKQVGRILLQHLECRIPCPAASVYYPSSSVAAASMPVLVLSCAVSRVHVDLCKNLDGQSNAMVRIAQLSHCVLEDTRGGGPVTTAIPLALEQPTEWQPPVAAASHPRRTASPHASAASGLPMKTPTPEDASLLNELFRESPAEGTTDQTTEAFPTLKQNSAVPTRTTSSKSDLLYMELEESPARYKVILHLQPLWLFAPSMMHVASMLDGACTQVKLCAAAVLHDNGAPTSPHSVATTTASELHRGCALQLRSGRIALFVGERKVALSATPGHPTVSLEASIRQAVDQQETLAVVTEAATVVWNSEIQESNDFSGAQTVLHLQNISICAFQGMTKGTPLLQPFGVRIQRHLMRSGETFDASAAATTDDIEEWRVDMDALQLTLTHLHYTTLLRVALQQTSSLAAIMKYLSLASRSIAAVPQKLSECSINQMSLPDKARRFLFHLSSLRLRVHADKDRDGSGPPTAVYFELNELDAAYYAGQHNFSSITDPGDDLNERGVLLRVVVTLASCLLGTENVIPTLSITSALGPAFTGTVRKSCSLRVAQEEQTKAYRGALQTGQVIVTVEAVPMMAWVDLLYTPYLQVTMPGYQSAKEHVVEQDLWLNEDLVLSERTPLRVTNKRYSLVYIYGNGHTIHMNASRHGQLIFLEEGVTLRIMDATVCMAALSIEAYVAAGNGSYAVIDPETCTAVAPPFALERDASSVFPTGALPMDHQRCTAADESSKTVRELASLRWQRFIGEVEVELRIPEPCSGAGAAAMLYTSTRPAETTRVQRTLVLYTHLTLCLVNSRSVATNENELTGAFDLAHVGVRSEYCTQHGGTAVDTSDLVSDWALKVLLTEEQGRRTNQSAGLPVRLGTIHVSASTGVEVRARYSDAVFVARALCHAQAAASRWQDAVRRDVWYGFSSLHRGWDAVRIDSGARGRSFVSPRNSHSDGETNALVTSAGAGTTVFTVTLQIPYVSLYIVDDSQDNDTPLFCLYAKGIHAPECTLDSLRTSAELRFVLQLEYYDLSLSQWAQVLEPVEVQVSFSSRKNVSAMDLYDRKSYARLSTNMSSVKLCFSLEMLRNVRQLLMLQDMFELAGADALATRSTSDVGFIRASVFHAFKIVQTIGFDIVVQLPEYLENPQRFPRRASGSHNDDPAFARARVLCVGQEWDFNLPRYHGKELPQEHQKIIVQRKQKQESLSSAPTSTTCGAVISLASVGVQRVTIGPSGLLQRYILADVTVPLERQGQKQVLLHTLVTFTNRLSVPLLHLVVNTSGRYNVVGVVPPASSQCVPVQILRRRVTLSLGTLTEVSTPTPAFPVMQLSADSTVSLGISYDSLPCLVGTVFLCVCSSVHENMSSASRGSGEGGVARIAVGKNFVVLSGMPVKTYFLLRIQAAARQPADVLRQPSLFPLRSVVVTAEAVVTIRNAVGVPLTVTLLTRRVEPGKRMSLLDTAHATVVYTRVCSIVVDVDGSYGASEMDPLEDVCLGVSLQQPNGVTLSQWPTAPAGDIPTAQHPPACVYTPLDKTRRDTKLVLVDPVTNATLVLAIKYTPHEVTLYCPHWIFNETGVPLQLADTARPHHTGTERCIAPIAGLSGHTVRTATVSSLEANASGRDSQRAAMHTRPLLYQSLRSESCNNNKSHAGINGLFLRLLESTGAGASGGDARAVWSDWSSQPLLVHEAAEVQVIVCASRHKSGSVWVLSCRIEMGHQASVHAYSDTRVISIRPRWVLVNKSPYALRFSQHSSSGGYRPPEPIAQMAPFTKTVIRTLVAPAMAGGRAEPLLSFSMCDDRAHNIEQCLLSPPFAIHTVEERYVNLVYQTRGSLSEHWPQTSTSTGSRSAQGVADHLPPLCPEDILEADGELFVKREEAKVFSVTTYEHMGCMMCVQVEEAVQPPLVLENRTSFTVCFRQRGARRVSTVFPRRRKAWTWDAPPEAGRLPAEVELWVPADSVDWSLASAQEAMPAAAASCVLNFDPQQIGRLSNSVDTFQCELDVEDRATGTSSLLFVRVRDLHGISYAVSITMEPTIDIYRTLPFPQLSFALNLTSMYVLCRTTGKRGGQVQDMVLLAIQPVDFSFAQGSRGLNEASSPAARGSYEHANEGDVQRIQLRFRSFQIDDERPSAKQRVAVQLVDDKDSGFQIERKLLRCTPILYCSLVAAWLAPLELHIEDEFIAAIMSYVEEVVCSWETFRPSTSSKRMNSSSAAQGSLALLPPWQVHLERQLAAAQQYFSEAHGGSDQTWQHRRRSTVPLGSRVVAIEQLLVDPLRVSLSLYRAPGAGDDPLWKLAGAASLLIGSTQDARLQWDAVNRRNVCDTVWHLVFLYRGSYVKQMKAQYMRLVNIMGLNTVRSFVSDLLNPYSNEHSNRHGDGSDGRGVARWQKQRVPCRRTANLQLDGAASGLRRFSGVATTSLRRVGVASASSCSVSDYMRDIEEAYSATASWLLRVPERVVQVSSQRRVTVAEVARTHAWHDFMAVAQTPEIRAFGSCALAHALAQMQWTPRYSLQRTEGDRRRLSASEVVRVTLDSRRRDAAGSTLPRVDCSRCIELEALREARWHSGETTPLPHPVREGFLTWEEFAHHINWYEFVDMCTDEEVRTYASLVCQGASEASRNVCILTAL